MSSTSAIPDHLIRTKLYPPRVPERLVSRQQLIDRLNEGRLRPVTLISASAGSGKSTLVTQWLKTNADPFAWLSLDEYDRSLDMVLDYLIAALGTVYPEIGQETKNLLKRPQLPDPERLADSLLCDLQNLSQPVFLVIDDFHTISNTDVHLFMTRLVGRLPADLHLVLISRVDPPLGLAQLRGRGQLQEIRGSDLRFTTPEAAVLLEQIVGEPVDGETVNLLAKRTEGWPAGLRMAAMSLREADDHNEFARRYVAGGHKLVSDYLLSEVLDRLPNEQRLLLLRTSVVNRFCAPLIDLLAEGSIPDSNGYDFLQALWSSNFFLIALDDQGVWYRYHHLFRQLLQQQLMQVLSKEAAAALHLQASSWFEGADFIEEAIFHALKAGDSDCAAIIVEDHVYEPINQEDWRLVDRWVNLLPEDARRRPGLLATQAMLEQIRFRMARMLPLLDEAEERLQSGQHVYTPEQEKGWMGVVNTFRAVMFNPSTTPEDSLHYSATALQQVAPSAKYVHSVAELWQIYALQQAGDVQEAIHLARSKLASQIGPPDVVTNRLLLAQCAVLYGEADVRALRNLTPVYLDLALRSEQLISVGWAHYIRGWSFYQENRLEEAETHFQEVMDIRDSAHVRTVVDSVTGLTLIQKARGELAEARRTTDALREFVIEQSAVSMLLFADSLASRLNLDCVTGGYIPEFMGNARAQQAADLWELPVLASCHRAIQSGDEEQFAIAEKALADCHTFALSRNSKRQLLQINALQALLHNACGESKQALDALGTAILIGEPGGALRYFVDLGPGLIPLLRELRELGTAAAYIERIMSAYGESESEKTALPAGEHGNVPAALSPAAAALMAELTNREMEVLLLLGERFTNKEIAERLYISPGTVKKYSINIYRKMEVGNRRQAVARALEMGILSVR